MFAKLAAILAIVFGWVVAISILLFLRTFEDPVVFWLWILAVIAFLPRETYKVFVWLTTKGDAG